MHFNSIASTVLKGKVEGFENKVIKVGVHEDYITFREQWLAQTTITDGSFKLELPVKNIQQLIIKIDDKRTSLFVEDGAVYNLKLSYDETANQGRIFDKFLDLNFSYPQVGETNQLIKKFNKAYQDFFADNYQRMLIRGATEETTAFIEEWKKKEAIEQNKFVAASVYINA